jgi:hypothetical protein
MARQASELAREPNHEAGMRMVMRLLAVLEALEARVAALEAMLGLVDGNVVELEFERGMRCE